MQKGTRGFLCFLILLSVSLTAFSKEYPIRFVKASKLKIPPLIDGNEDKNEWSDGTDISQFVITNGKLGEPAVFKTHGKIGYDNNFLYILLHCDDPEPEKLKIKAKIHDDPLIFFDDRIEVFLDVDHIHRSYYDFIVNPAGVQAEQSIFQWLPGTRTQQTNLSWNSFWKAKTKINKEGWTVEIAIDLKSLGVNTEEDIQTLGFNIGRARHPDVNPGDPLINVAAKKNEEYSAFTFVQDGIWETPSNFYEPWQFADLSLGQPGISVSKISFHNIAFNGAPGKPALFGYNPLSISLSSQDSNKKILKIKVYKPASGKIFDEMFSKQTTAWTKEEPIEGNQISTNFFLSHLQENLLEISILDANGRKVLYKTSYVLMAAPMVTYDLESVITSKKATSHPVLFQLNTDEKTRNASYMVIKLEDSSGKTIKSFKLTDLRRTDTLKPLFDPGWFREMKGGNYCLESNLYKKSDNSLTGSFKQHFTKFSPQMSYPFGATHKEYRYGGQQGPAVVVRFPNLAKFVFWRNANYIPFWEIDQATMSNEFVESWDDGMEGCAEPIQDRECRYSNVTILENSQARVRIKWRYALNDAHYRIHANEWVDEIYTFYPDGSGVREVNLWANTQGEHEVFEAIFINPPGVTTYQLFDPEIISLKNLSGDSHSVIDFDKNAELYKSFVSKNSTLILETHFKNRLHPFTVFALQNDVMPMVKPQQISVAKALAPANTRRGHWPSSYYPVDGYNVVGNDIPGHFSLGNIHMNTNPSISPNRWLFLIGVKEKEKNSDINFTKNWLTPGKLKTSANLDDQGYDRSQKAYIFNLLKQSDKLAFQFTEGGVLNPVIITKNVKIPVANIYINGKLLPLKDYHWSLQGQQLIVFIYKQMNGNDRLEIELKAR